MALPRITAAETVTVPAGEEKSYPDLYIQALRVRATPGQTMSANVNLLHYDYDTGDFQKGGGENIRIQDLEAEAVRVPALAQTMGLLISTVGNLVKEKALVAKVAASTGEAKTALEEELVVVQTALGIE